MSAEQLKAKTARELDTQKVADEAIKIVIEHLIWGMAEIACSQAKRCEGNKKAVRGYYVLFCRDGWLCGRVLYIRSGMGVNETGGG